MYCRSLYAEYAVCLGHQLPGGVTSQLLKKTMIIIDGQLYQRKENKDENEACASLLGAFLWNGFGGWH